MSGSKNKPATMAGYGAILLWSVNVAISRSLTEWAGALLTGAMTFGGSGLLLLAQKRFQAAAGKKTPLSNADRGRRFVCALLFLVYTCAFYLAIGLAKDRLQMLEVALLNYLWPALTVVFVSMLLPMRVNIWLAPGLLMALLGISMVLLPENGGRFNSLLANISANPFAYAFGLIAAITWGLYSALLRRWQRANSGGVAMLMLSTGVFLGIAVLFKREFAPFPSFRNLAELIALIVLTASAYALWDYSMRHGKVNHVAAASNFTPFFATLFSCIYLHIAPSGRIWIGACLIAFGSLVTRHAIAEKTFITTAKQHGDESAK